MFIDHMEPRNITNLTFLGEPLYSFGFPEEHNPLICRFHCFKQIYTKPWTTLIVAREVCSVYDE
jgi:hypothetical protein